MLTQINVATRHMASLCHNELTHWPLGDLQKKFRYVIFKLIFVMYLFCEIALKWISMNPTDDKSALVQVMAWCPQATSHYLSQCWPRSLSPLCQNELTLKLLWDPEDLTVPSHCLDHHGLINKMARWHLDEGIYTETVQDIIHYKVLENYMFENTAASPRG